MTEFPRGIEKPSSNAPISLTRVLAVEGATPFYFFKGLLKHLGLSEYIELRNFGGNQELRGRIRALALLPGFADRVVSFGVVRDAETGATAAFRSVADALASADLEAPDAHSRRSSGSPATSVFILPDGRGPGTLETLCRTAVSDDPASGCVDEYFICLGGIASGQAQTDKAWMQAFLASRDRFTAHLGEGAQAGHLPWESPEFNPLIEFLRAL